MSKKNKFRTKESYRKYLDSDWWVYRKSSYWSKYKKICFCCNHKATELHHVVYKRLGEERDTDLLPLCNNCHRAIHSIISDGISRQKAHLVLKEDIDDYYHDLKIDSKFK